MTMYHGTEAENLFRALVGSKGAACILKQAGRSLPQTFRFNPLKHTADFQARLLQHEQFEFSAAPIPGAYEVVSGPGSVGKSLTHFLGDIYIQDLASMLPPLLLDPQPGETVLDLCSAPGSKTSQIAGMMRNQGVLVANDVSGKRIRALAFNLRKFGSVNTLILRLYGEQFGNQYFECFDRILVDPPCSALGTLQKSPDVLERWQASRSERYATNQTSLLTSALKALRPGGVLVYSTCTLAPEENEAVLDAALREFPIELDPISSYGLKTQPGLTEFQGRRFHPTMERAIRVYPHENEAEGFFIARIRKTDGFGYQRLRKPQGERIDYLDHSDPTVNSRLQALAEHYALPESLFRDEVYWLGTELSLATNELKRFPLYEPPIRMGLPVLHLRSKEAKITTEGSHLLGEHARKGVVDLPDFEGLAAFVNRDPLACETPHSHQVLVRFDGQIIGHALVDNNFLLSRFPRTGWRFELSGDGTRTN